jgi:hypothetical protein
MRVGVCSIFRNSGGYLERYFDQINSFREHYDVTLFLAEGDSSDDTLARAREMCSTEDTLLYLPHGGPLFTSVDNPQRWEQIAQVIRPVLDEAIRAKPDILVWVESDLIWDTDVMVKLVKSTNHVRSVAPMVFIEGTSQFYDVWGYRMAGKGFLPHMPYFPTEGLRDNEFTRVDTCGSCFATQDYQSLKRWSGHWPFRPTDLWVDTTICVRHP